VGRIHAERVQARGETERHTVQCKSTDRSAHHDTKTAENSTAERARKRTG